MEDLALGPLGTAMTRSAVDSEDLSPGRKIDWLRLIQRPYGSKDPQGLQVQSFAASLCGAPFTTAPAYIAVVFWLAGMST